jgi:hypothetical protein
MVTQSGFLLRGETPEARRFLLAAPPIFCVFVLHHLRKNAPKLNFFN